MEDLFSKMEDLIPPGLPTGLILVFLFISALLKDESFFLVYYQSTLILVELETEQKSEMMMFSKMCLEHLFQDPLSVTWEIISYEFKKRFPEICVFIDESLTVIPINSLFLGHRNILVKTRLRDKIGKFMGFSQGFATNVSVLLRNSNIVIQVPIESIIGLPTSDQLRECDEEFEKAKIKSVKNHEKRLGRLQVPSNLQKYYPEFSEHLLQILYHLFVMCNVKIGFKYRFNRLVFRLLKFGDQIKFSRPQLSEQEQATFKAFKTKYNDEMVGKVIHCRKARFLPKESGILKNFKSMSHVEALSLPASYWNRPEHCVELKKLKLPMLNHLFTDPKVFDELT